MQELRIIRVLAQATKPQIERINKILPYLQRFGIPESATDKRVKWKITAEMLHKPMLNLSDRILEIDLGKFLYYEYDKEGFTIVEE